ncbi:hypothetical protein [Elizabethkingia anophelis]|uniref:hypothetical protein n=1 Tax=Elizabethkingia anophelis TaxID=1117645 RepID=UPI0023E98013|nr:hypothetical protein [Elizabethkingia anophelis]GJN60453.1 hypothetical protein ELAK_06030 [Elizabethkingia anophelis]HDP3254019.1 hypothetical protein [Elizabethkingia anophelis]
MEAKYKAEELVNKMHEANWNMTHYSAVSCAIVCVEEMIQLLIILEENTSFYEKVKSELEKMKSN